MITSWPGTGLNSFLLLGWQAPEVKLVVLYALESALIGESESKNEYGLLRNHEYTVVEFELVENRSGEEIQLVRLRNPWGFGLVHHTVPYQPVT